MQPELAFAADFRLELQPSFKIRGKIEGYSGPKTVSFELLGEDGRDQPSRALLDVSAGNFQILDVTPGTYKLRASQDASQKMTRGEAMVTLGSSDVSGVSLALLPPVTVSVSIRPVASGPVELATSQITLHPSPLYMALSNMGNVPWRVSSALPVL